MLNELQVNYTPHYLCVWAFYMTIKIFRYLLFVSQHSRLVRCALNIGVKCGTSIYYNFSIKHFSFPFGNRFIVEV